MSGGNGDGLLHTLGDLAEAAGCTPRTVSRWRRDASMPHRSGPWSREQVEAIRGWAAARRSRAARHGRDADLSDRPGRMPPADAGNAGDGLESLTRAELDEAGRIAAVRFRSARAEREATITAQLRGTLIPRSEVAKLLVGRALAFKRSLLAAGRRLAPLVVGLDARQAQTVIDDELTGILRHYSRAAELEDAHGDDGA